MLSLNLKALERFNAQRKIAWNRPRVMRLCAMLQTTPAVLAVQMGYAPRFMENALANNKFPGVVCYVFELWEQYVLAATIGESAANVCPDPVTPVKAALVGLKKIAEGGVEDPQALAKMLISQLPALQGATQ